MMTLNQQIAKLEQQIISMQKKIDDLSKNTENKPNTISFPSLSTNNETMPTDIKSGAGDRFGASIPWNDSELKRPPINVEPDEPTKGFSKHSHSRYSGGALIKDVLEIVEYVWDTITNKHSQQFWSPEPKIATETNSNGEQVDKIGPLGLSFDADAKEWLAKCGQIDVKKTYLVQLDSDGNIELDSRGQEMKSSLWNVDSSKSAVVWDENAKVWRFYAVYAPGA